MVHEDHKLVSQTLAGDSGAFEQLVGKYNKLGGAIAYGYLGDFDLAEDVVQDACLKALRGLEGLRKPELFRVWFSGIVRKRSIDVIRQRKIRQAGDVTDEAHGVSATSLGPEETLLLEERREKVLEALAELGSDDRLVIVLKHMEGLSYKEISEITNTSVSSVESRLFRARHVLKSKLTRRIGMDS